MQTISISYTLVWQFKTHPHLKITRCKKVINAKTGRMLKQCINGGSVGYWIDSKTFITKNSINERVVKIKESNCPY